VVLEYQCCKKENKSIEDGKMIIGANMEKLKIRNQLIK